jgi:hypothetical protein
LPAAPFAAGVEVQYAQRGGGRHLGRMACPADGRNATGGWNRNQMDLTWRGSCHRVVLALANGECRGEPDCRTP